MVNYWFDTFKHLKSFDILPYQEVVDLYLKNQSLLDKSGKEKLGVILFIWNYHTNYLISSKHQFTQIKI